MTYGASAVPTGTKPNPETLALLKSMGVTGNKVRERVALLIDKLEEVIAQLEQELDNLWEEDRER